MPSTSYACMTCGKRFAVFCQGLDAWMAGGEKCPSCGHTDLAQRGYGKANKKWLRFVPDAPDVRWEQVTPPSP